MSVRLFYQLNTSYGGGINETNIWGACYHSFDESNPMLHELLEFPV